MEPSCGFDYDSIDRDVFSVAPRETNEVFTDHEIGGACSVFGRLVEWLWADATKNCDGLQNRAAVICWVFIPELRSLTLTDIARGFGKDKQALGRAVDSFKDRFPKIRIAHMKD